MLKKATLIYLITLILCSNMHAQEVIVDVTYKEYYDTFKPVQRLAYLYSDGKTSLYEEDIINTNEWLNKKEDENIKTIMPEIKYNNHLKINHSNKEVYFFDLLKINDYYLIKDNYTNHNWKLINETKKIANYKCYKAECDFRGRKWIVWYTPEINVSSGPWKLYGLPGLILEAYDETRKYNFSAEKITFEKNDKLYTNFSSFRNEKLSEATLEQFLILREEFLDNGFSDLSKERGTITRTNPPRSGRELIYEWEQEPKK